MINILISILYADLSSDSLTDVRNIETILLKVQLCDICMLEEFSSTYIGYIFELNDIQKKIFKIFFFKKNLSTMECIN